MNSGPINGNSSRNDLLGRHAAFFVYPSYKLPCQLNSASTSVISNVFGAISTEANWGY